MTKQKKKKGWYEWMVDHGIGATYTVLLSLSITISKWILIGILFFIAWWESVR